MLPALSLFQPSLAKGLHFSAAGHTTVQPLSSQLPDRSTDELWTPPSIASLLTVSVIDNIRLCFSSLSPPVKLKLLLGMLHLPRRTVDEVGRVSSQLARDREREAL